MTAMATMDNSNMPPVHNNGENNHSNGEHDIYADLYTIDEAAEKIHRHRNTVNNMRSRGELDETHIGRTPYVFKSQVDKIAEINRRRRSGGKV